MQLPPLKQNTHTKIESYLFIPLQKKKKKSLLVIYYVLVIVFVVPTLKFMRYAKHLMQHSYDERTKRKLYICARCIVS